MNSIDIHREALKERQALPAEVGVVFAEIEETLLVADVRAAGLAYKRARGWGRRTMLVGHTVHRGTTYRMACEVVSRNEVVIWAYGPHEGFYKKLGRRARQ